MYTYTRRDLKAILQHYEQKWGITYGAMINLNWEELAAKGISMYERNTWVNVYKELKDWDTTRRNIRYRFHPLYQRGLKI